ncbi:MAG: serine/threonine-protein phosphatase, partial [Polyangiales bacterium]
VITRALGMTEAMADVHSEMVRAGDVYLLCSDGLYEPLEPEEIAAHLDVSPELACQKLIDAAYNAGSTDNISAVVVRAC